MVEIPGMKQAIITVSGGVKNPSGCYGIGLDNETKRLIVTLADGTIIDVADSAMALGATAVAHGGGSRLLLMMGFETHDDGEPHASAKEIDQAVEVYRQLYKFGRDK